MTIQTVIDEIEDYVGGNIEQIDDHEIDRMAFAVFLREQLEFKPDFD